MIIEEKSIHQTMYNKAIKLIRSRSLGQPKAVLRTFLVAPYVNRYV